MAREYPTYFLHIETRAKSKGTFIFRTVFPRLIAKIEQPPLTRSSIEVLEWIDECTIEKKEETIRHLFNWCIATF